jgi:hypothetical protein
MNCLVAPFSRPSKLGSIFGQQFQPMPIPFILVFNLCLSLHTSFLQSVLTTVPIFAQLRFSIFAQLLAANEKAYTWPALYEVFFFLSMFVLLYFSLDIVHSQK